MNPKQPQRKRELEKDSTPYRENKRAFDAVILYFRRMDRPMLKPLGAINPQRGGSGPNYKNPLKPMPLEFWCDVQVAIRASLPKGVTLAKFALAYLWWDSESEVERNTHAYKVLGGRCHSVEQRVGAEFLRRQLFPLGKYLNPPRPGHKEGR